MIDALAAPTIDALWFTREPGGAFASPVASAPERYGVAVMDKASRARFQGDVEHLESLGLKLEEGWDEGRPSPPRPDSEYPDELDDDDFRQFSWQDHCYMLKRSVLPTIYVSEPYHLHDEDFAELGKLVADGWDVRINIHKPLWNPGYTIPIWISRDVDRPEEDPS